MIVHLVLLRVRHETITFTYSDTLLGRMPHLKYTLWCSANGLHGVSSNRLSRKLKDKGFKLREDKRTWLGVGALN
jgi:hypothetical protein